MIKREAHATSLIEILSPIWVSAVKWLFIFPFLLSSSKQQWSLRVLCADAGAALGSIVTGCLLVVSQTILVPRAHKKSG